MLIELIGSEQIRPGKALDICCGAGSNPIYLAKQGFSVTRLDISDYAVIHARKKARESYAEMDLLVGSFLSLPFKQAEFNLIFDFGCFHHVSVEKRTPFITGVHRVLKPNGTYVLTCARTPPEHTQDYCRTSGELSNLKTE
ncbi:MAG: class I SAM-dependent methyltransferase [Candidatus Bathyarchaeota archaeon]|nr:MAG: class I SAM-dependent methyltransferase [Candidatus Bathyarchaeota archaeon]